jgi:hypothetical protein
MDKEISILKARESVKWERTRIRASVPHFLHSRAQIGEYGTLNYLTCS